MLDHYISTTGELFTGSYLICLSITMIDILYWFSIIVIIPCFYTGDILRKFPSNKQKFNSQKTRINVVNITDGSDEQPNENKFGPLLQRRYEINGLKIN